MSSQFIYFLSLLRLFLSLQNYHNIPTDSCKRIFPDHRPLGIYASQVRKEQGAFHESLGTSNIQHPTSNTQPPINGPIGTDFGCWVLDVSLWFMERKPGRYQCRRPLDFPGETNFYNSGDSG